MSEDDEALQLLQTFSDSFADFTTKVDVAYLKDDLHKSLSKIDNELEKADFVVTLAYLIYDLIWIYLRTKGIDPMQHSVINELDRIKQYFGKIKKAKETGKAKKPMKMDKEAANRFIKAAIASGLSNTSKQAEDTAASIAKYPTTKTYEVDTATRFKHLQANETPSSPLENSEDEVLMIVGAGKSTKETKKKRKKDKGKAVDTNQMQDSDAVSQASPSIDQVEGSSSKKKKRKHRHAEERNATSTVVEAVPEASTNVEPKKKKKKKRKNEAATDPDLSVDTSVETSPEESSMQQATQEISPKKKRKKNKSKGSSLAEAVSIE